MNKLIVISAVLVLTLFFYSCSIISGSTDEPVLQFEKESFFVDDEHVYTFRSLNIISVSLKPDIDLDEFNDYINAMDLQLITPFTHSQYSKVLDSHLQGYGLVILLLPPNADRNQFYSFSDNLNEDSFAKNRFINYSLPAYTRDTEQLSWYYPNNKIFVKPISDDFSVSELSARFNLEFQSKNSQIDLYLFKDNEFLHGSPYELAGSIHESGNFRYVVPGGFWQIVRF